ncbi:bifunctional diguanylate cyclase/phosphodiesterase [Undibacterium sp. Dicai25W]|uniref:bifunctional diguanylate cyclase/phosphodiesterase n=1 Tax=Undibacterium sp. Dicai25W TaxID=3413034 RepID=UPI003BEF727B
MPPITRRFSLNSHICAILTFFVAISIGVTLIIRLERSAAIEDRLVTTELASLQIHTIEDKLAHALSATYAVASLVKDRKGKVDDFDSFADHLLEYHPGISALYLAPDGITTNVVPAYWRKYGLGINLLTDPSRKTEALLAKNTNQLTLAGPLTLKRGSIGIIGRLPVYLKAESGQEQFWGMISVVITLESILKESGLLSMAQRGHDYELWRIDPATGNKQTIDKSTHFDGQNTVHQKLTLPNAVWYLDVVNSNTNQPLTGLYVKCSIVFLISLMLACMVKLLLNTRTQKRNLEAIIADRTREVAAREADLSRAQSISATGSWIADNYDQIHCSNEAYHILKLPIGSNVDCQTIFERIHPDDQKKVIRHWKESLTQFCAVEFRLSIDGEIIWIHSQIALDRSSNGKLIRRIGTIQNITDRKRIEDDLRVAAIAFEGQEGMVITDEHRNILRVNKAFTRITGYSREEALGKTTNLLKSGIHGSSYYKDMSEQLQLHGFWQGEIWNRRKNGEIYPEWLTITAVRSQDGKTINYVGTMLDITQRKATEAKLEHLAYHDPLTGLANRRLLLDRLQHALASNMRNKRHGAILFLDLDNFKTINDINGHGTGDMLLQQVAKRLSESVGKADTLARIGGDEFALILEGISDNLRETASRAKSSASQIIEKLKQPYFIDGHEYHTTASIGIDFFSTDTQSADELLKQVEVAMYEAKSSGGDTLCFFDPIMLNIVTARATMEAAMRTGIYQQQFLLYYQPQVNSAGKLIGAEALLRWQHPLKGMISPADFIPLAEESGLIIPLGTWILKTACQQLRAWSSDRHSASLTMAVNVSAKQFRQPDFVKGVLSTIEEIGVDARKLKLELTESLLVDDIEETICKMNQLKAHGVCFSLDDFGTGYSSLSYLKRLPLDQLKIDQSFVRDILIDPNDAAITRTIIGLGKSLGLAVIAEGVETEAQLAFLQSQDCHAFQGYLFGKPAPELNMLRKLVSA